MSCLTKVNQRHNSKCDADFKEELRSSLHLKSSWRKDHCVFPYQHGPQLALCTLLAYPRELGDSSRSDLAMQIRKALQPIPLHPADPDWSSVGKGVQLPMVGCGIILPPSVLPSTSSSSSGLCMQTSWAGGDPPASSLTSQIGGLI